VIPIRSILCLFLLAVGTASVAQGNHSTDQSTPSEHRKGPNGLEGWKLEGPVPDTPYDKLPFTLVIARNGKVIRRFDGDAFIWKWMFLEDGKRVAYESGPLHFSLACILADVSSGKRIEIYDCYHDLPADAPAWVRALESNP
jgi:hypothetical protein